MSGKVQIPYQALGYGVEENIILAGFGGSTAGMALVAEMCVA